MYVIRRLGQGERALFTVVWVQKQLTQIRMENGIGFSKSEMEVGGDGGGWAMAKTALEELDELLRTIGPPRGMGWGDMCVIQRSRRDVPEQDLYYAQGWREQ